MRSKEEAHDYRYFPDPDLLPLELEQGWVDDLKQHLPELPDEKHARFMKDFGLSAYDANVLVAEYDRQRGPILVQTNATGPFALVEFTGALPRAKL